MAAWTPGSKKHMHVSTPLFQVTTFLHSLFMVLLDGLSERETTHSLYQCFFYPFISCLHFLHQLFIPRWRQLIFTALSTNELYLFWQIPQALILIHSDALTFGVDPMVTFDTVHHLRIKVIIRIAFITKGAEVVLFPLTPTVLAMCKFKHP